MEIGFTYTVSINNLGSIGNGTQFSYSATCDNTCSPSTRYGGKVCIQPKGDIALFPHHRADTHDVQVCDNIELDGIRYTGPLGCVYLYLSFKICLKCYSENYQLIANQ